MPIHSKVQLRNMAEIVLPWFVLGPGCVLSVEICKEKMVMTVEVPLEKLSNSLTKNEIKQIRGGLGGTTYPEEERGDAYEGVDLTLGTVCKRESTIERLLKCLLESRIILVRSPPMAGKTTLAQLFEHSMLQSVLQVLSLAVLLRNLPVSWCPEGFEELMNVIWDEFLKQCGDSFKRTLQSSRLYIIAFASYGHYGAYTTRGDHTIMNISPCFLQKSNTREFENVHFTREEFNSYFNNFSLRPGLVAFTMNQIHMKFVKHTFEYLTFAKIFVYRKTHDFNDHFKNIRAMPKITDMSNEEKKIADTTNILVDTSSVSSISTLNFPAPLLRATYLQDRFGNDLERVEFYRASNAVM
ncbi:7703_t:CDS:10 [Ambispora leptoticha]|uniref:7703_t:CDS:1 n=1 Tax=Ambispora leptoticha TaxID=144679 RepID=A0A9N9G6P3_9GLOM|nr:7703_t:CDS:10 [Ambispora leptoticha]